VIKKKDGNLASKGYTQQLLYRNVQRFRGGLVFKAHRLVYHSTLGLRVTKRERDLLHQFRGVVFVLHVHSLFRVEGLLFRVPLSWLSGKSP